MNCNNQKTSFFSWIVVLVGGLFFFYEFIQMNMLDAISQALIQSLHINAAQLGAMSSYYFLANVIFLMVAGTLLDRYSTRLVMLISLGVCVLGTALFSTAEGFLFVSVCRFLTGIGSAFCFLSVLRLASRWFPPKRMALITGIIVTMAMTGGAVAQTPFEKLVLYYGWRETLQIDAVFGVCVWLLIALIVRNYPAHHQAVHIHEQRKLNEIGYVNSLRMAFLRCQNWFCAFYTSFMNLPINVLGGLWGILYLTTTHHFSKMEASYITSMLFIGTIFGSPLMGWLSDWMARRKPLMVVGAVISIGLMLVVLHSHLLNLHLLMILFFAIGFFSSTQIISYALVAESSPRIVTAMSVSIVSFVTIGGIGVIQGLYGYLLQLHAENRMHFATTHYVASDFCWAMMIFLVAYVLALIGSLLVKETYCVQKI